MQREAKAEMGGGSARPVSLRVGAIESVQHSRLIDWIQRMRGMHRELELELTVVTSPVLAAQVKRGSLDMVLTAMPAAPWTT
ncbi:MULTISPECIES: LysR substrate-binding domain-containing protein [Burkholderiales]|uniref:LysR substrate-binding domain-containing protein n=1 Tax=Sphaerotilus microaerophilus TaxID=2914710 RepID=A0ABN6PQH0_9BURK|nr:MULTISPECIES: LysR substrate-binding domain-containing protein [Burkholderiales]BDI06318.1 hypothetical protein CATMQ487_32880 [Sphaerotilus sp. FB-5]